MNRYIDAEKIEYEDMLRPRGDGNYEECQIAYRDQIDDIPTADVRENVKGEWEHGDETARYYLGDACVHIDYAYWRCSACGKVYEQSDTPKYKFCPNCGAQMI